METTDNMELKMGAEKWLEGRYFLHQGCNNRHGAILQFMSVENKWPGRGKTQVVRVKPDPDCWPEKAGVCVSEVRYALRNLPADLLEMTDQERHYHDPIFQLYDPITGNTYPAPDKFHAARSPTDNGTVSSLEPLDLDSGSPLTDLAMG
jgi:hypothetical protein